MSFSFGSLHFSVTLLSLVLSILVLSAAAFLCLLAFRRAVRKKRTGALELLRFVCILLITSLFWEPEWRTVVAPDAPPEVLVLYDESRSMDTEDSQVPPPAPPGQAVETRSETVKRLLADESVWTSISEKNTLTLQPFGSAGDDADLMTAGTDLFAPLDSCLENSPNLRSVVLLTDGDYNTGQPPVAAAQRLRLRDVPLYAVPIGSTTRLPDLDLLSVTAPTYGIIGENVQIPFTIRSSLNRDVRTTVSLRDERGQEQTKSLTILANSELSDSIVWRLNQEGTSTLTLSFPFESGELIERNNSEQFTISGRPERIKVLVIETSPRWEYRYIRNALSRDPGVDVDCLLYHPELGMGDGPDYITEFPESLDALQKYDVVFLGDIGIGEGQLTTEQAELIKGLVENQASGVVFIPGSQGNTFSLLDSPLADLLPVQLDPAQKRGYGESVASPLALTSDGSGSLLTMLGDTEEQNPLIWRSLPGFFWHAPVVKALGGSTVLAVHANRRNDFGRIPLIVSRAAGNGKVLFMGIDSAWRWRRGVEDLYHYRFWGQVARWMSYQRNVAAGERVRLFFTPERPQPGDTVRLTANAFDAEGAPLEDSTVLVQLTSPENQTQRIQLENDSSKWGTFSGLFKTRLPGEWKIKAFPQGEESAAVETSIIVQGTELEKVGQPARPDVLEELARVSRGAVVNVANFSELADLITLLPEPKPLTNRLPLWSHPVTAAILIGLLSLFWLLRKLNGTF